MSKIWRYVLVHDSGRAPCVDDGMMTLCCCKPMIRKNARVGDWVVGIVPKRFGVGLVAWAGRVSTVMPMGAYCEAYPERTDALYRLKAIGADGREVLEHVAGDYHGTSDEQRTDASGVNALVFSPFWYFGSDPKVLPDQLLGLCHYYVGQTSRGSTADLVAQLEAWLGLWQAGMSGAAKGTTCRAVRTRNDRYSVATARSGSCGSAASRQIELYEKSPGGTPVHAVSPIDSLRTDKRRKSCSSRSS